MNGFRGDDLLSRSSRALSPIGTRRRSVGNSRESTLDDAIRSDEGTGRPHRWHPCSSCRRFVLGLQECAEVRRAQADRFQVRLHGMAWVLRKLLRHGRLSDGLREEIISFICAESGGLLEATPGESSAIRNPSVLPASSSRASSPWCSNRRASQGSCGSPSASDAVPRDDGETVSSVRRCSGGGTGGTRTQPQDRESQDTGEASVMVPRSVVWDHPLSQREKAVRLLQLFEDECQAAARACAEEVLAPCEREPFSSGAGSKSEASAFLINTNARNAHAERPDMSGGYRSAGSNQHARRRVGELQEEDVRISQPCFAILQRLEDVGSSSDPRFQSGPTFGAMSEDGDIRISPQCFALLQKLDEHDPEQDTWRRPGYAQLEDGPTILERATEVAMEFVPWS